jgi:hypothetical protein
MTQIRRKNGTIEVVDDDYILASGESIVLPFQFRDEGQRAVAATTGLVLHDGMGNPAGYKPGYVFADADDGCADADAAYSQYCRDLQDAWMDKERREQELEADRQAPDLSDVKALRDAADETRRQYIERTVNAWRTAR